MPRSEGSSSLPRAGRPDSSRNQADSNPSGVGGRRRTILTSGDTHDRCNQDFDGGRQPQHADAAAHCAHRTWRSEEHTSELQSLMRISYAVLCLKKKKKTNTKNVILTTPLKLTKNSK